jgi:FtsP/CotA-like multicopper oxidase with cupredoxin domain
VPNCLSTTNPHFHGLHVSPTGNSDNVLLEIPPSQNFEYEVNVPVDHPAGTFWYHSHRHGSTAAQVSSGMVGALIVRGRRTLDERAQNGGIADIDTILKDSSGAALKEKVILLQQIAYACFDEEDNNGIVITTRKASDDKPVWYCPPDKKGEVKYYSVQFGPGSWRSSGHFTMITGQMQPQFGEWQPGKGEPIHAGEIQRWRLIHAGVRDTVALQIIKATNVDPQLLAAPTGAVEQANWVDQRCKSGAVVPQWEFAVDGLTRAHGQTKALNILQPAYRSEVLITFPSEGVYCVLDQSIAQTNVINPGPDAKDTRLLALVKVGAGTPVQGDPTSYMLSSLIAANPSMPPDVGQQLREQDLSVFAPNADLSREAVARKRDSLSTSPFPSARRFALRSMARSMIRRASISSPCWARPKTGTSPQRSPPTSFIFTSIRSRSWISRIQRASRSSGQTATAPSLTSSRRRTRNIAISKASFATRYSSSRTIMSCCERPMPAISASTCCTVTSSITKISA